MTKEMKTPGTAAIPPIKLPPVAVGISGPPVPPSQRPPKEMPESFSLLYLDIDGVLNSVKTCIVHGRYPFPARSSIWQVGDSYVEDLDMFDPYAIAMLNKLLRATNTYVILSSTWRKGFDMDGIVLMMEEIGIDPRYILGRTDQGAGLRGGQVRRSLATYQRGDLDEIYKLKERGLLAHNIVFTKSPKIISYVIIDDNDEFDHDQQENFVHTTEIDGLTLDKTLEAGSILTSDIYYSVKKLQTAFKQANHGTAEKTDEGNGTIH